MTYEAFAPEVLMPRTVSWMGRLAEIRRSVENSVRTHYSRRDLEILFKIQPRAANNLMDLMPTEKVSNSLLVPREALGRFLDEMQAEDVAGTVLARRREEKMETSRKRPRKLLLRDIEWVDMDSLPSSVRLEPGRLEIRFDRVEDLVRGLWQIATMLVADIDRFIARFEPPRPPKPVDEAKRDMDQLEAELQRLIAAKKQQMEAAHGALIHSIPP